MRDYFMGAEVELEELELGAPGPDVTPPQGVILTHLESDGWIRKYLYKASYDGLGSRKQSKILMSEVRPDPGLDGSYEPVPQQQEERPVYFQRQGTIPTVGNPFSVQMGGASRPISPVADNRLNLPPGASVPFVGHGPLLGQMQAPPAPAPAPVGPPSGDSLQLVNATPPPPPAPPAGPDCTRSLQLPDGTVLNPEDSITLKDFCAMIPWLENLLQKNAPSAPNGPIRPGGRIPLSAMVPSFGPAGGPFAQGGFGGGGGGGATPGAGPIGVVTGPTPVGGPGQGTQGPPGPAGPPGPGVSIDGAQKTDGNFSSTGAMVPIPGLTFSVTVGADGKLAISFSFILQADFPGDIIYDVFAGIQIDATQYQLWENSEQQGAGSDKVFTTTATGVLFASGLTPGPHTVSVIYGDNPALNHFTVVTTPSQPACVVAQHS